MVAVVLVHGIRTSATMWRGIAGLLDDAGVRHVAVDLPGHGALVGEPFTLVGCARVLDDAVAALDEPTVVAGLSLGSYVGAHWAATTAMPPRALVLASCGTRPRGPALTGYIALARLIGRLPDAGLALHSGLARAVLGEPVAADLLAGGAGLAAMVPALRAVGTIDLEADLRAIPAPVWFVNGAWDHFRTEERRLLSAAPSSTLVVVPRGGHVVALDQPEAFARTLLDVVDQARLG